MFHAKVCVSEVFVFFDIEVGATDPTRPYTDAPSNSSGLYNLHSILSCRHVRSSLLRRRIRLVLLHTRKSHTNVVRVVENFHFIL